MIKLNRVTIGPFCFPRSRLYDSVTKHLVVSIRTRKNLLSGDLFSEKVGGRLPNKKGRRTGWSQVKPEFAKIKVEQKRVNVVLHHLQDAFDRLKTKTLKQLQKSIRLFNNDLTVRGGENCWTNLPVIKMKFNLLNKTSSFLIVLKFRKTYIQIVKIVSQIRRTSARRQKCACSVDNLLGRVRL